VTGFICEVDEYYRSACEGLPFYAEHEGKRYCVLHFPGQEKVDEFRQALDSKLAQRNYDFGGTFFPDNALQLQEIALHEDATFRGATFAGGAHFFRVTFNGHTDFSRTTFAGDTNFANSTFNGERTDFSSARFSGEHTDFSGAVFNTKSTHFARAHSSSKSTHFSRTTFSGERTEFVNAKFSGERADFGEAEFSGKRTEFGGAEFGGVQLSFSQAKFGSEGTHFFGAKFGTIDTNFSNARFSGERTDFREAEFGSTITYFREANFTNEVNFFGAAFREKVAFWGSKANTVFGSRALVWFHSCRIDKPELLTFNTVLLHPGWFIHADVRKVDFTDVKWFGLPGGPEGKLADELHVLRESGEVDSPHTLLSQACRRLSTNAEENREYPLANEFHYWSMEALRKQSWRSLGLVRTLYWALSGYGVRAARAFWVLVGIWAAFATLYVLVGPSEFKDFGQGISYLWQAAVYSLLALVRLNPEPTPEEPGLFQFLVGLEGILGPLQIALLALAIRRKVMR
jgi:uncharacterized protein YjbI with pentapeptide repeats